MAIDQEDLKRLKLNADGLITYEYIANHIDRLDGADMEALADIMIDNDRTAQFTASAARYLQAIDPAKFAAAINRLVATTIDRDREHRYLPDILSSIYGDDCLDRASELCSADNNFRRIYKRLYPNSVI